MLKLKRTDQDFLTAADPRLSCSREAVILFTGQLACLLRGGIHLHQALTSLSQQPEHPGLGRAVAVIANQVAEGYTLDHAMALFPRIFPGSYRAVIRVGLDAGRLVEMLDGLARWRQSDLDLFRRVKAALMYPAVVLALSALLTFSLFRWIMPGFVAMFAQLDLELPLLTRLLLATAQVVSDPGICLGIAFLLLLAARWISRSGPRHTVRVFRLLRVVPLVGTPLHLACVARYASSLAVMLGAGLRVDQALLSAADGCGSPLLTAHSRELVADVEGGSTVSEAMAARPDLYPCVMTQLLAVGEETSRMVEMLNHSAALLRDEVDLRLERLTAFIEPALLLGVATVVGLVLWGVFAPLYGYLGQLV